ncbi:hypothetical protein [Piscibacillus salipiscarius]|uniref:hypothetical protein n=1 Tax=Piscibacillus salipiscarius TaxID=299480 RepID=UPI0024370477|nr:hypothetical protein [Piscibacillus salipiscarius]
MVSVWNRGFEGYSVDVTMDTQTFLRRMVTEDLVAEASIIALDADSPVAIVMNGFRKHDDKVLCMERWYRYPSRV